MAKDKSKPIRCLIDATDLPPSAFALRDDGRKEKSLCLKRKILVSALARHADPDGSNCFPSKNTLKASTGFSLATIKRLFNDLVALGFMSNGDTHPRFRTIKRTLSLPKLSSRNEQEGPGSGSGERVGDPAQVHEGPGSGSMVPGSGSLIESAKSRQPEPPPLLTLPLNQPTHTPKSASENLDSYKRISKWLPDEMKAAQKRRGEKEQIDTLISEHGGAKFLAALKRHCELQDSESKLSCKWTAFLENFDGWLSKLTSQELEEQRERRWRQEHPEEYQRQIDASIERQQAEVVERMKGKPSPYDSGESPEDFMAGE